MSRRSFLASVTSLVSNSSDADNQTLAGTANESTVALIPKPNDGTRQNASGSTDTSSASASTSSQANDGSPPVKPQEKDWEAAFAKLSSTMGFTGSAPTIPQAPKSYGKTSSKKKSAKTSEQATTASSSSQSNQTASSKQATSISK